jgi:Na+-transporting NADH:ubiquinone oxidoreductase subunit B
MKLVRKTLDRIAPHFESGGRFERLHPLYEGLDSFLFKVDHVTRGAAHVRDGLDLKRMMMVVVVALIPCVYMAMYNTGHQAALAVSQGAELLPSWQASIFDGVLGLTLDPGDVLGCILFGALHYLPVLVVVFAAGGAVEVLFSVVRKHEVNEGFLVTGMLLPLILPPTIPLWQAGLGTVFGVLFGKEVFGGTGMNFLNPALVGRAFLFFAYPAQLSGEGPWIAADFLGVDGFTGATILAQAAAEPGALEGASWSQAFLGLVPGSMGETSALACLLGAALLILTRVGSWRTMAGVTIGTLVFSLLLNWAGSETNPMFAMPFHWHVVLGGWAFGAIFMATDPVSSAFTERGKWAYGFGIGALVVLIRVVNPAYPEGMMLAILFMNMFAPLIDYVVIRANVRRRLARDAA